MNAEIITVGTELLLGDILNSNSQFLSRELAAYGVELLHQSTVGDNQERLAAELAQALSRSDLVLITGGLGPTQDDLTRETVCTALNLRQELHEESWARIQEYFRNTGRELTENNKKQAMLPAGCVVFPNDHGTAPGCAVERYGQCVIMLPGPPRELVPMFNDYVAPYLSKFSGGTIFSRTVGVFGIPESAIAQRIADLMSEANPSVAPYAKDGEVVLRVTARAADSVSAAEMCDPVVAELKRRLGINIYGVDAGSLQKTVVGQLRDKGFKIATAESCTAGLLSSRLTEVPGASAVFECGVSAYSWEIKHDMLGVPMETLQKCGAVSPEVACAMAVGVRRLGRAQLGIGITGEAGPESAEGKPVGTVYIALADEKRVWVKEIVAGHGAGDREYVRWLATSNALDLTRRYLEAYPTVMAGGEMLAEPVREAVVIPEAPRAVSKRPWPAAILPWPGDGKAEIFRKAGILLAVLLLLAAGFFSLNMYVLEPIRDDKLYDRLALDYGGNNAMTASRPEGVPDGTLAQFYLLYEANEDVRGWLKIDRTSINYPVMQSSQSNPDYYTNHNFEKQVSSYGTPYFDSRAAFFSPDSVNRNLVIYGNNTGNGKMFSELAGYRNLDFFRDHAEIEMNTLYRNGRWRVFAVMIVSTLDPVEANNFDYARSSFEDETAFLRFVAEVQKRSLFTVPDEAVDVQAGDSLLMLSTDIEEETGLRGARLVVAARRTRTTETQAPDMSGVAKNAAVLLPQELSGGVSATRTRTTLPQATATAESSLDATSVTEDTTVSETTDTDPTLVDTTRPSNTGTQATASGSTATKATTTAPSVKTHSTPAPTTSTTASGGGTQPAPPDGGDDTTPSGLTPGTVAESAFMDMVRVKNQANNAMLTADSKSDLQLVVSYMVKQEMGAASAAEKSTEAWKAQAVASYSYLLYTCRSGGTYSINTSFNPFSNAHDKRIYDAVGQVLGVKVLDVTQKTPAAMTCITQYFSSSCGATACNHIAYAPNGQNLPYLQSVSSPYDTQDNVPGFVSTAKITLAELKDKLTALACERTGNNAVEAAFDTGGEWPLYAVSWDGGRGRYVATCNAYYMDKGKKVYFSGYDIRRVHMYSSDNPDGLRSHCWEVTAYDPETGMLTLRVKGNGHGIGMSQYGAIGYANKGGWNYQQIVSHYYSLNGSAKYKLVAPKW